MKVVVIGIGAVGSVLAKFLSSDKNVESVVCADLNLDRAKKFLNFKSNKVKLVEVDANNMKSLISVTNGCDLIINTSLPRFNENIMKAALEVKSNYQDLCSHLDSDSFPEQFKLNEQFKKMGLVALINTGMAPGITNILAKDTANLFDEIDIIKVRTLQNQIAITPIFALSPEIIMEESLEPAIKFENGNFVRVKQFSEFEDFEFYPGYLRFVYSVYGDEVSTLSRNLKAKNINFMAGGTDIESSKAMFDLGLFSTDPIKVNSVEIVPFEFLSQIPIDIPTPSEMSDLIKSGAFKDSEMRLAVEVSGKRFGVKIKAKSMLKFHSAKEINLKFEGANYISFPTGLAAYCFSKVLISMVNKGVFAPESLPDDLISSVLTSLISHGVSIERSISSDY